MNPPQSSVSLPSARRCVSGGNAASIHGTRLNVLHRGRAHRPVAPARVAEVSKDASAQSAVPQAAVTQPEPPKRGLYLEWVLQEGADQAARVQASHLSLEGDFNPEALWPAAYASEGAGDVAALTADRPPPQEPAVISAAPAGGVEPVHPLLAEEVHLETLLERVRQAVTPSDRVMVLMAEPRVQSFVSDARHKSVMQAIYRLAPEDQYLLLCLPAMNQAHVLSLPVNIPEPPASTLASALTSLVGTLHRVEQFYDSIGGVLGYQARSLDLIIAGTEELRELRKKRTAALPAAPSNGHVLADGSASTGTGQAGTNNGTTHSNNGHVGSSDVSGNNDNGLVHASTSDGALVATDGDAQVSYHVPQALDLAGEGGREVGARTAAAGLAALPSMAEIYPLGGAGDRLGLTCEQTGECLPAAMLPYCGRTMLEGLMRDLTAREFLYYRITGHQVTVPVAIMTSEAKGNHTRITSTMDRLAWFGRGRDAFRIFKQPLVPVVGVADGRWLLSGIMRPMSKPGGHGAIWKLMWDEGVFEWFASMGRTAALVRQISNPMAGMDTTLLALAGCGATRPNAAFGFMSCDRTIGAAEGCNVLQERRVRAPDGRVLYEYGYTNIEYTEFDRLGIADQPVDGTSRRSVFPANTNVLYVGLGAAAGVVRSAIQDRSAERLMPGLIFNLKKQVAATDPLTGNPLQVHAGRMECTMQNIADYMTQQFEQPLSPGEAGSADLSTFLVYNMRRKVTSSAKKKRVPGTTKISQTPDGSFYDLQRNAWHLLQQCGMTQVPELGSVEQYLERGPGFIFLYHPALGPLWDVIAQKVMGGSLSPGSELVLEVAEARLIDVHVDGSLLIHADNVLGHMETPPVVDDNVPAERRLVYSSRNGRVNLTNVRVVNRGVNWAAPGNVYWKHSVERTEAVQVLLRGQSEFEAHDITLVGPHTFEVPDGYRMVLTQDKSGYLLMSLSPLSPGVPTWQWVYRLAEDGRVVLQYVIQATLAAPTAVGSVAPVMRVPVQATGEMARAEAAADEADSVPTQPRYTQGEQPLGGTWANSAAAGESARLRVLQQLSEVDVVLDFTI